MRQLILILAFLLLPISIYAGDSHLRDSTHKVVYTIGSTSSNYVTGETVRITVTSRDGVKFYDFNDGSWKAFTSCTTPHQTMNENADGNYYYYTVTIDSGQNSLISGDVVVCISNDSATYRDLQCESINFSPINDLIKIYR